MIRFKNLTVKNFMSVGNAIMFASQLTYIEKIMLSKLDASSNFARSLTQYVFPSTFDIIHFKLYMSES